MRSAKLLLRVVIVGALLFLNLDGAANEITVYKTTTCGCCSIWVDHLKSNGFQVTVRSVASTAEYQAKFGVPEKLQSCHTAVIEGYTIEGHVPASEIQRLLKERPKAKGLAVPGMPMEPFALMLVLTLGIMGILTPYGTGPSPVYYGSGYLPAGDYWRLGAIFGFIFITLFLLIDVLPRVI